MAIPIEKLVISVAEITVGDVEALMDDQVSFKAKLDILEKAIVEGDIRKVRVIDLPALNEAIMKELNSASNPQQQVAETGS